MVQSIGSLSRACSERSYRIVANKRMITALDDRRVNT